MDVKKKLKSSGKAVFVNCFETARRQNGNITQDEVVRCNYPASAGWETGGFGRRIPAIHDIFAAGKECEALKECFTIRGDPASETKARNLYSRFCSGGR